MNRYIDPANPPEQYPASIFLYRNHIEGAPIPPPHIGGIYHYTGNNLATTIFESGVLWASRFDCMNDPGENVYGWSLIHDHYQIVRNGCDAIPDGFSQRAQEQFDEIFAYDQGERWLGNAFVLSASIARDRLDQFRFYGDTSLELPGGVWTQVQEDMSWRAHERRAAWRPVIYNKEDAIPYIEDMLKLGARIIDEPPPWDFTDEGLVSMMTLRHLALLIKHPEYKNEEEVRLVLETQYVSDTHEDKDVHYHQVKGEDVFYVKVHPESDGISGVAPQLISSVRLGPTINDSDSQRHMHQHMNKHLIKPSPPLHVSRLPYHERGQTPVPKP